MREKYGVDAPGVVWTFAMLGAVIALAIWPVHAAVQAWWARPAAVVVTVVLVLAALMFWTQCGWMLYSSLVAKRRLWRRTLDALTLRGNERVLEVGPGRGAVLVTAARRIPDGRLTGVDIWRIQDQSGNGRDALLANARTAGVADRIEVVDGDMRDLPFPDREFDLALASLAIHNLPPADRATAVTELLRVLKPGARVVILDFQGIPGYADTLRRAGAEDVRRSARMWSMHPPVRVITASAPTARSGQA
jgi:arsenite methyltransferase